MSSTSPVQPLNAPPRPPAEERWGASFGLAVGAHLMLVAALALGVQWRSAPPEAAEAELWAAVPQTAGAPPAPPEAPPPPPPPPPPEASPPPPPAPAPAPAPDPQIAIEKKREKERLRKEEERREHEAELRRERELKDKKEQELKNKKARDKKAQDDKALKDKQEKDLKDKDKAEKDRLKREAAKKEEALSKLQELERLKRLEKLMGQTGQGSGVAGSGTAAQNAGPSAGYGGKVRARIQPLIKYTGSTDGAPTVTVVVRVGPDGTVLSKRVTRASGRPEWDAAVLRAIDAAITIPKDVDGRIPQVVMSEGLELTFTP